MKIWEIYNKENIGKTYKIKGENGFCWTVTEEFDVVFIKNSVGREIFEVYNADYIINQFEFEEYVDWSQVSVDTKILVRHSESDEWIKRYFAKYENGKVYAWANGSTSYSSLGETDCVHWVYAELYKN